MLREEMAMNWDIVDKTKDKEKSGRFRCVSVGLKALTDKEQKEVDVYTEKYDYHNLLHFPRYSLREVMQKRLTKLLKKEFPGLRSVDVRMSCFITERIGDEDHDGTH